MYVKLKANWFGPDGRRYRMNPVGDMLTYVPDELARHLPSTARIAKPGGGFEDPSEGIALSSFDEIRQVMDAEGRMIEKAENHRAEELVRGAEELKRKRQDQAAKMRAAKDAKRRQNLAS
jgi:hypothetical protein